MRYFAVKKIKVCEKNAKNTKPKTKVAREERNESGLFLSTANPLLEAMAECAQRTRICFLNSPISNGAEYKCEAFAVRPVFRRPAYDCQRTLHSLSQPWRKEKTRFLKIINILLGGVRADEAKEYFKLCANAMATHKVKYFCK